MEQTGEVDYDRTMDIFHHHGAEWKAWLTINPAGKLIYHYENDGLRYLRRGPESSDEELTLAEALRRFPEYVKLIQAAVARREP
jgi:hypothetical protein